LELKFIHPYAYAHPTEYVGLY